MSSLRMHGIAPGLAGLALVLALSAPPAQAVGPMTVVFGTSWDAPSGSLQNIVDSYLGSPGLVNVTTDFVGAGVGEPDVFFWIDDDFPALLVREVAGYQNVNTLGWYKETGAQPVIDGVDDGVVFAGAVSAGGAAVITFPGGIQNFGFYLNPNGTGSSQNAPEPEHFFTNRLFNDLGPSGAGAIHAPFDGDVQAIVFDVSPWKGEGTYLVCFEDLDYGANPAPCCTGTDNDYNDLVFEVRTLGSTPAEKISFGGLKARYRR